MLERNSETLVRNPFFDVCQQVDTVLDGPDIIAAALPELRTQVRILADVELPSSQDALELATERLATVAQRGFVAELRRAVVVAQVFPASSLRVEAGVIGLNAQVPTVKQFKVGADITCAIAEELYGEIRAGTIASVAEDIDTSANKVPEFSVEPQVLAGAYDQTVIEVGNGLETIAQEVTTLIRPVKRSLAQFVTGKAVQFDGVAGNAVTTVNRNAKVASAVIKKLLINPTVFFADEIVASLGEQYAEQGRQAAILVMRKIIRDNLIEMNKNLLELSGQPNLTPQTADDEIIEAPVVEASLAFTTDLSVAEVPVEHPSPPEYNNLNFRVKLNAPWLDDDDNKRDIYRFNDGHGNTLLAVDAMGDASKAIERQLYRDNAAEEGAFRALWLKTLHKAVSVRSGGGSSPFKMFGFKAEDQSPAYVGFRIAADGPRRQADARRIYFTQVTASRLINEKDLQRQGIAPDTPLVALLGICRKKTQIKLIQELTTSNTRFLRVHNVGSV